MDAHKSREIFRRFAAANPHPVTELHYHSPFELLVAVILSAQCTDARVNQVTRSLFRKYRSAQDYAAADPGIFEQEIRSTGFFKNKAKLVIGCARRLVEAFGGEVPGELQALVTLPGVGRKTANMVLGNAFAVPGIPVDTHVLRVANRLGLAHSDKPDVVEAELARQLPSEQWTPFSNALILHGRETCTARHPHCKGCMLYACCEWSDKAVVR